MFKLPFRFKSTDISKFLTIDIGSNAVKCFAFDIDDAGNIPIAEIVGVGKVNLEPDMVRGGVVIDTDGVSLALQEAIFNATSELAGKYPQAVFGLSGDLSINIMTTVKITRGKREAISQKELDGAYAKIYEAAQEEAFSELMAVTGNSDLNIELVTSSTVYTKLDGRFVPEPLGENCRVMEIALFTAFTPSFNTEIIKELAKQVGIKIAALSPGMYSLTKALKSTKGNSFDAVIMDIGSDITDISVIFGGGIVTSKCLPLGGMHFTNQIGKKTGLSHFGAEEKKKSYSYGILSEDETASLQETFENVLEIWLSGVELLFTEFTGVKTFSPTIFLVGGGATLPDISDVLTTQPWTKSIPFKSPPEFVKLSLDDLANIKDITGKAESLEDVVPASLALVYLEVNGLIN